MNLAQVQTLERVLREAQPLRPLYADEDEPKPEAIVTFKGYENDDISIRLWSPNDLLAVFPNNLYIDDQGTLYQWDDERPESEAKVPVELRWRYGVGDTYGNRKFYRYLDALQCARQEGLR